MGHHLVNGEFKSDKHPELPAGKIVVSFKDPHAQRALWELSEDYKDADPELAGDIKEALFNKGFKAPADLRKALEDILALSADRERFVLLGARGFMAAETIAKKALGL